VGYIGETQADWLMARLAKDGKIRVESELKLLIHILQEADACPHALIAFTLDKLKDAVLAYGKVTRGGVDMLRAVLYAAGGDGNITVARPEAEVLFDINDACRQAANDPEWSDFFAKAVGAAVMLAPTYEPESKEDALKDEAWLKSKNDGIGSFLTRMFKPAAKAPDLAQAMMEKRDADDELLAAAEPVTADEAHWLVARLGKGGTLDAAEQALVEFLRKESPSLDPALQPLLDEASRAA
jgi:hypothetical protein